MRWIVSIAVSIVLSGFPLWGLAEEPEGDNPIFATAVFKRIHTDGKSVLITKTVPSEGDPVEQEYTVMVPVVKDGKTEYLKERRVRLVKPTRLESVSVSEKHSFTTLGGNKLNLEEVMDKIPMGRSLMVAVIIDKQPIPAHWKELFRPDVVVMRVDNSAGRDDAKKEK